MKRVFIAGATGYVRSALTGELLRRGHHVCSYSVQVRSRGCRPAVTGLKGTLLTHPVSLEPCRSPTYMYTSSEWRTPIYQEVRAQCEELIIKAELNATILRPWYILGPRRWWPLVLTPIYSIAERFPATRAGALRLGRVRHHEMVRALANAVEAPAATGQRYFDVPGIRAA